MSTRAGRRMSVDERRAALLRVGKRVFSRRAYDEVSTDELAKLAKVSAGLFYHYFSSKRGFYVATLSEVARDIMAVSELEEAATPREAITGSLTRFLDYVDANGRLFRALLRGGIGSDREVAALVERVRRTNQDRVFRALGLDDPAPAARARVYGWIGFAEFVALDQVEHGDIERDAVLAILLESLSVAVGGAL